jgi:hypothetical protein
MDLVFPIVTSDGRSVGKDLKRALIAHIFDIVVKDACWHLGDILNCLLLGCVRSLQGDAAALFCPNWWLRIVFHRGERIIDRVRHENGAMGRSRLCARRSLFERLDLRSRLVCRFVAGSAANILCQLKIFKQQIRFLVDLFGREWMDRWHRRYWRRRRSFVTAILVGSLFLRYIKDRRRKWLLELASGRLIFLRWLAFNVFDRIFRWKLPGRSGWFCW